MKSFDDPRAIFFAKRLSGMMKHMHACLCRLNSRSDYDELFAMTDPVFCEVEEFLRRLTTPGLGIPSADFFPLARRLGCALDRVRLEIRKKTGIKRFAACSIAKSLSLA